MTYLIFFTDINGHNLEYCHHLYEIVRCISSVNFIIIVPEDYNLIKNRFKWIEANNVKFEFINCQSQKNISKKNLLLRSFYVSKLLKECYNKFQPKGIFVPTLNELVPILPFLFLKKTHISGIIYRIYLYEWHKSSLFRKILDSTKMWLLAKSPLFSRIFILNDEISCRYLNRLFSSSKFVVLPDPYIPISDSTDNSFRTIYNIPTTHLLFSHIGSMNTSKGTIDLLDAIDLVISKLGRLENVEFAFVGKVSNEISEIFYSRIRKLQSTVNIIVKDEFCEYEAIANLCRESNLLILPYKRCSQSSGIIGYASQFSTPVLMPNEGLLARLVRYYDLGYLYSGNGVDDLAKALIRRITTTIDKRPCDDYCKKNSLSEFSLTIKNLIYEDIG